MRTISGTAVIVAGVEGQLVHLAAISVPAELAFLGSIDDEKRALAEVIGQKKSRNLLILYLFSIYKEGILTILQ